MSEPPPLAEGMIVAEKFRLLRPLGEGGMASVWVAWHTTLAVEVALKFIAVTGDQRADALRRFKREATLIARVRSPHVVHVLDYGIDAHERAYLAMELLNGESLRECLERDGSQGLRQVSFLVSQVCKALSRAHNEGIVHRDIKPDNLFLVDDEDGYLVKVLDFGIAKTPTLGAAEDKTKSGTILGTPMYMSPEQALGLPDVDHRSDLYSLALVAWHCLTGREPYDLTGMGLGALIVKISTQPLPPPSEFRTELSPEIDAFFERALAKEPDARFGSAKELSDGLHLALGQSLPTGISRPRPELPAAPASAEAVSVQPTLPSRSGSDLAMGGLDTQLATSTSSTDEGLAPQEANAWPRRAVAGLVAAAALGLAAWGGAVFFGGKSTPRPAQPLPPSASPGTSPEPASSEPTVAPAASSAQPTARASASTSKPPPKKTMSRPKPPKPAATKPRHPPAIKPKTPASPPTGNPYGL